MDVSTSSKIKHLLQVLKSALQDCLTHKSVEERRSSVPTKMTRSPSASASPSVLDDVLRGDVSCDGEEDDDEWNFDDISFDKLPYECKLKIFSFLTASERGKAERVCNNWRGILKSPSLWTDVDLSHSVAFHTNRKATAGANSQSESTSGPVSSAPTGEFESVATKNRSEAEAEFEKYKARVAAFVLHLKQIKPCVKFLRFSFDIGDSQDGWMQLLKSFLDSAHTKNMKRAAFNWKDTPAKPTALLDSSNTWSTGNYSDLMYKQRRRQRIFVSFFDSFTALVPNLECLSLPFDWSQSSVAHLSRLGSTLVRLYIEEYFVPQPLEQDLLNKLLANLSNLEVLSLGLVLGSGLGMSSYEFSSPSLRSLDLSKCQGFALMKADLPNLRELRASNTSFPSQLMVVSNEAVDNRSSSALRNRQKFESLQKNKQTAMSSPLKTSKSSPSMSLLQFDLPKIPVPSGIPCLFNVLKKGAPQLEKVNGYKLKENWRDVFDPKLEKILHQACPCLYHHQYHQHYVTN